MQIVGIIPARYASTRLPGKPLADIAGKPMIQRVYEAAVKGVDHLFVATDSEEIFQVVENFGGKAVMTGEHHENGTSRCAEAMEIISSTTYIHADVIINIQGDEPLLDYNTLRALSDIFLREEVEVATLIQKVEDAQYLESNSNVFVTKDKFQRALYFSRSVIPFIRDVAKENWLENNSFYKHIGMYAFRPEALKKLVKWNESDLEKAEKLEQLRWLENGQDIYVVETNHQSFSIDTPEDLAAARSLNWNE
jgi:3-deoxy-manno-octulosonate cytidylyltransferase (CMP-KDO synthetase)